MARIITDAVCICRAFPSQRRKPRRPFPLYCPYLGLRQLPGAVEDPLQITLTKLDPGREEVRRLKMHYEMMSIFEPGHYTATRRAFLQESEEVQQHFRTLTMNDEAQYNFDTYPSAAPMSDEEMTERMLAEGAFCGKLCICGAYEANKMANAKARAKEADEQDAGDDTGRLSMFDSKWAVADPRGRLGTLPPGSVVFDEYIPPVDPTVQAMIEWLYQKRLADGTLPALRSAAAARAASPPLDRETKAQESSAPAQQRLHGGEAVRRPRPHIPWRRGPLAHPETAAHAEYCTGGENWQALQK